jgi:hypothetical protein
MTEPTRDNLEGAVSRTLCSCGHGRGEHSGCLVGWGPGSIQSGTGCPCRYFDGAEELREAAIMVVAAYRMSQRKRYAALDTAVPALAQALGGDGET